MTGLEPIVLQSVAGSIAEITIKGLGTAGIYVMIAAGLSLIFGLMGVLNFAHGALTTYGAYLGAILLVFLWGSNPGGSIVFVGLIVVSIVVFVVLSLIGAVFEYSLIRRLYDRPPIDQILLTFGVALTLDEFLKVVLDDILNPYVAANLDPNSNAFYSEMSGGQYTPELLSRGSGLELAGTSIRWVYVFEFFVGALVVAAVWLFLTRTRYGLFIRAGSEDSEMAEALGINVRQVFTLVFGIGIGLAGVSGIFLIWDPGFVLDITLGSQALLPAFIVVVVGGLGTFKGTVVAAGIAGFFFQFGNFLFSNDVGVVGVNLGNFSQLPGMLIFILLVAVLIIQPTGLYGEEEVGGH
ncbi:branched-chain amino acid ABC transporter permease [Salinibaculum salinum]|uniref:branched-chain amino acid ABC transporter permease n=1 Tax=Salinibaculum salinum TaxID=3131996 RepID=UPI0030EF15F8